LIVKEQKKRFKSPLYLESGRILDNYEIAFETYGKLNQDKSNVILITHALTGNHHVAGKYSENDRKSGWWDELVGENKTIDTTKYYVISTNVIGSCFGSTGPMSLMPPISKKNQNQYYRLSFPVVSIKDMVKAQHIFLKSLGINKLKAIVGGSMGAMQGFQFGVDFPDFAEKIIAIAGTHATQPYMIAYNKVAQSAILADPDFKNGLYDPKEIKKTGLSGLAIGRMAGHISFLSHESMQKKFGRNYDKQDGEFSLFGKFDVENYLDYNGIKFSKEFDPLSYLYIIKAINMFDLSNGYDSLKDALSRIKSELYIFSFKNDLLFRPYESEHIYTTIKSLNMKNQIVEYTEIDSDYGHDAFLVKDEIKKFKHLIIEALNR
jgi:homoserine O-acetyltransferase